MTSGTLHAVAQVAATPGSGTIVHGNEDGGGTLKLGWDGVVGSIGETPSGDLSGSTGGIVLAGNLDVSDLFSISIFNLF